MSTGPSDPLDDVSQGQPYGQPDGSASAQQQYPPVEYPQQPYGQPQYPAAQYPQQLGTPPAGRNGLAIAGFILAFLVAPIGLILSLVALVQASRRRQSGKVLAVAGIVVATLEIVAVAALVVFVINKVPNLTTVADRGCIEGKLAITENSDFTNATDVAVVQKKLQATVTGLDKAAADATHPEVRDAMKALSADYKGLLAAIQNQKQPPANAEAKATADGQRIDALCTVAGIK